MALDGAPAAARATILIADDDNGVRTVLNQALSALGYDVRCTDKATVLWRWISEGEGDLVIADVVMPDENGLDLLPRVKSVRPELPIVVMSAQTTRLTAIEQAQRGAYEYLPKPFDLDDLARIIERSLAERSWPQLDAAPPLGGDNAIPLIGRSPAMQDVFRVLARLMGTELTVLITGESGTGKELVARALHDYGTRRQGPFVALSMAAIPRELIESDLFGHEKGAFTGAEGRTMGRFEQAQRGTLFLDEIGDIPLDAQTRLLRVLQEGKYTTVGGRKTVRTDVRVIAATNRDLRELVRRGLFSEDLFYRLNVGPVRLPPLREHTEDIPDLVRHFLAAAAADGLPSKTFDSAALQHMMDCHWPGNVRELEHLIRRLVVVRTEETIGAAAVAAALAESAPFGSDAASAAEDSLTATVNRHLSRYFTAHGDSLPPSGLYSRILHEVERPLIALSLAATRGNQLKAARLLGLNRNTLRKKIRELGIPINRAVK